MSPLVILGIIVALILVWDGYLQIKGGEANTISVRLMKASKQYTVIPFLVGVLCGHLFWANIGACP